MSRFIVKNGEPIAADHIAVGEVGPTNIRGVRPVILQDARGFQLSVVQEADIEGLPGFVRFGNKVINLSAVKTTKRGADGQLKLYGSAGAFLAEVDAEAFLEAVRTEEAAQ